MSDICIIGGSGFVGTRLIDRLIRGDNNIRVCNLDKVMSQRYPHLTTLADVRSPDQLAQVPQGAVMVNLAAEHRDDVRPLSLYHDVNVQGTKNLCQIARQRDVRTIVFTSSVAVYGFAELGTGEQGAIAPFNDYGKTKYEAEQVLRAWQAEESLERTLVIVRPTVIFGENNRGNVYNLLRQIASGKFAMVGNGANRKSMAYVENVAAFIEFALTEMQPGAHCFNYIDKPDFTMNTLVATVNGLLGRPSTISWRIPFALGLALGKVFDGVSLLTGKRFPISAIRVKKFCANSVYATSVDSTSFQRPVSIEDALQRTVKYEFVEQHERRNLFYSE